MADTRGTRLHIEAEHGDDLTDRLKLAAFCFALSAVIIAGGFVWLGRAGMLDTRSPDFIPIPHFFATAAALLGLFFLALGLIHGRRYRLFGTSVVEANQPALGEAFAGALRVNKTQALRAPITLALRCDWRHYQSGTGTGSSGHTVTTAMWEAKQQVDQAGASVGLPFHFDLPADGLPSGTRPNPKTGVHPEGGGLIVWTLRASSPRAGTDYVAEFEIPVKPGKLIAELSKGKKPAAAPRALSDESLALPLKAAAQIGGVLLGGYVPTQDELDDEAEANSRAEPDRPFAGTVPPEQSGTRLFRRVALGAGVLIGLAGAYNLINQATFGLHEVDRTAIITDVERGLVTLDLGDGDNAHQISVSDFHRWSEGQQVKVLCVDTPGERRRCRMQTGFDRWIDGLGTLAVALALLGLWKFLNRPRRAL